MQGKRDCARSKVVKAVGTAHRKTRAKKTRGIAFLPKAFICVNLLEIERFYIFYYLNILYKRMIT